MLVALCLGLLGCGGDDVVVPTDLAECNHGPDSRGDDLQFPSAMHWLEDDHAYDEAADLYVCIDPEVGGTVSVTAPDGVEVAPGEQEVATDGDGILRFEVRVEPDASGQILARTESDGLGSGLFGPVVETDEDHWSFAEGD
ncbi:hypothetical protein C7S10_07620 [Nocardioides currus]|uniref:Uncharacterized protein n=1 Tax=Nocardioides currus TaxID=2133958 RepID=A0A2R7YZV2_9ACTN|nr:hypothetical protein C7S10_07620 [Nocardioides currus]